MLAAAQIGLLFICLALFFFGLSVWDYLRSGRKTTPARRAWLRVAVIFAIVGIYLFVSNAGS